MASHPALRCGVARAEWLDFSLLLFALCASVRDTKRQRDREIERGREREQASEEPSEQASKQGREGVRLSEAERLLSHRGLATHATVVPVPVLSEFHKVVWSLHVSRPTTLHTCLVAGENKRKIKGAQHKQAYRQAPLRRSRNREAQLGGMEECPGTTKWPGSH